ncbi:hypothetical protein [Nonomuraea salmonea]|uniref:hypothetical protein n=1 Tax=Nonomuraea salmonea TaxID=46181 RepID=UPI002FE76B46
MGAEYAPEDNQQAAADLAAAHQAIYAAEAAEVRAVAVARARGASWDAIAAAQSMDAANSTRKYGPLAQQVQEAEGFDAGEGAKQDALEAVKTAHQAVEDAEWDEIDAVAAARFRGVPWDEVSRIVEMRQPNAVRKYGQYLAEPKVSVSFQRASDGALVIKETRTVRIPRTTLPTRRTRARQKEQVAAEL